MHNSLSPFIAIARRGIPCDASCEKKPSRCVSQSRSTIATR